MGTNKIKVRFFSFRWLIWLFPILAVVVTADLFYRSWSQRGPLVEIYFNDAAGIEVGKTQLRFRGIKVGEVEDVTFSPSEKGVVAIARLDRDAKTLAVEGSQFWIIRPQVDFEGIRGLETILKGSYIRVVEGSGDPKLKFTGKTEGEESEASENFVTYYLRSPVVDSINSGDFVFYRGLKIGNISLVKLSPTAQSVDLQIRIDRKYIKVIRTNTVFWQKSAVDAKFGLFGSSVKIGPLETLIRGGINVSTPDKAGPIANAETRFDLLSAAPKDFETWSPAL